ncbi:glycosyltransferase [Lachnoanaerobaculum gingivalis]|uniref:glycosyltransferase n=1 Tax=Lachnoanaerobaculum gingivalis TaxID=2490855 RepID=UPI0024A6C3D2|nr:glycosyltransferase [Lachnoanaerobaculum gingivalis]WHE87737.1 glycosyltransferase [Lachnoanaerobaculum gingivalis]
MYNSDDKIIRQIKDSGLEVKPEEWEIMSFSAYCVGKSDKEILQTLVDLDLIMKRFFFSIMRKSKYEGREFFRNCHQRMKKKYEFLLPACSNDYERNKLNIIYKNSLFHHEEFYIQSKFASENPLITVLMPTFNSENYIAETLWSVFDQTCPDFEVLIMDEAGSSPETAEVISLFEDDRIRLVRNERRLGLAESLNEGIRTARGKYIARIDADDLAREDRFELQADFLEKNREYGLCGSRQHHFGVDNDFVHEVAIEHEDIKAALIYGCEVCHSTIMIRKDLFLNNNLFYDNTKKAEDYELWTRAINKFKFHNLKEVLGEYRIGADNITKNKFDALSAESAEIASNNLLRYLHVEVPKMHIPFLTGWENRFEEVDSDERKSALKVEESILREMVKNNIEYKAYKDSSLLMAINRRWRWVLGNYSYGHDLEEILTVDELFKKYPIEEVKNARSFSFKEGVKKILKLLYSPFKHGMKYRIRKQIWDLDGHLNDSKNDVLNHMRDLEVRLKQYLYQIQENNNTDLLEEAEYSFKKLEKQIETLKNSVNSQRSAIDSIIESRIYEIEKNLSQTFDSRIYKAEQIINQSFDSRIWKAEKNLSQTFDSRTYESEKNLSQIFDGRIWKAESNITDKVVDGFTMVHKHIDFCYSDIFVLLDKHIENTSGAIKLETEYPVAYESNDHIVPHGTIRDDTRYPRFIHACEMYFKDIDKLAFADFGCSSGGIVLDALLRGHEAVGLEGSDESFKQQRAHWRVIPKNLFTCDVTKPFTLKKDGIRKEFDVISAWEMLEHIREIDLDTLLKNIRDHLKIGGIFVGSIANWDDIDEKTGINWHVNLHPYEWWSEKFKKFGFEIITEKFSPYDMARGTYNPPHCYELPAESYDPEKDFYIVAKKVQS